MRKLLLSSYDLRNAPVHTVIVHTTRRDRVCVKVDEDRWSITGCAFCFSGSELDIWLGNWALVYMPGPDW